ncbi:MAG: DUF4159 domain-containing protein [Flavobacteriales bacterium]|nr:DUF4159 domain-containing protein [Flavobacteriales bacterium]
MRRAIGLFGLIMMLMAFTAPKGSYRIGVLKYKGGGDYYANPTAVPNLIDFCNQNLGMNIIPEAPYVEVGSLELFDYPMVHMTGHGNVVFTPSDAENLRTYLEAGGFLHIDDNYGLDPFIRPQMKKVFPESDFIELPFSHPIYHQSFDFDTGLPKVHEHDGKPPQGFGIFHEGRLVCFYSHESDLGDGWEDQSVHKDSQETRTKALQMGANIVQYAFLGESGF